jgi:hypothetical protein
MNTIKKQKNGVPFKGHLFTGGELRQEGRVCIRQLKSFVPSYFVVADKMGQVGKHGICRY